MLHAQKMDIRFLLVRPVMIRKKKKLLQRVIPKELEIKNYMSIKEKKELVNDIINECIDYEDGVFKIDEIDTYICFTLKIIL